jgi:hypothetical protein
MQDFLSQCVSKSTAIFINMASIFERAEAQEIAFIHQEICSMSATDIINPIPIMPNIFLHF